MPEITPMQTVGPFFRIGMDRDNLETIAGPGVAGMHLKIEGTVYDGDGVPVPDAMLEIWQADGMGNMSNTRGDLMSNTGFTGFGRSPTDAKGMYHFHTIMPGQLSWPKGGLQAPHLSVGFFSRGLLTRLHTRIYFEGEGANAKDPVLALVGPERRDTLIAKKAGTKDGVPLYTLDIHLQGDQETVFFAA
jgi:protocatechuate 3,4-dioxygenase alpha subunit